MRVGVIFPQGEAGNDPGAIREFAQTAEGLGYDHITVIDHVLGAHPQRLGHLSRIPYTHENPFHEACVLLGYLAAVTQRIELVTGVLVLPQRQTALVAKQLATIDVLSGGRLRLGVGVGWNPAEFAGLGADFRTRGRRQEEQIRLLSALWQEPLVDFDGAFHTLHQVGINPRPVQAAVPIWFGGWSPVVAERIARYGQGWINPMRRHDTGHLAPARQMMDRIRAQAEAIGRDPAGIGLDQWLLAPDAAGAPVADPAPWLAIGATHFTVDTRGAGPLKDHLGALQRARAALA